MAAAGERPVVDEEDETILVANEEGSAGFGSVILEVLVGLGVGVGAAFETNIVGGESTAVPAAGAERIGGRGPRTIDGAAGMVASGRGALGC